MTRWILHLDMDAFYASVEQRDQPSFAGRPVIVGADPKDGRGRGVVAACSYEARRYGVHSAMPISQAFRRCPEGVYVRPDFASYSAASREIRSILNTYSALVEPISIDEAFLDFTDLVTSEEEVLERARELKARILESQQLTASVGIGPSKLIAKIASDFEKPDGLYMVREGAVQDFLDPLPVSRIWGVGPKTSERLGKLGIETVCELRSIERSVLSRLFGQFGGALWKMARGIDNRQVSTHRETKSVSHETTFLEDEDNVEVLEGTLEKLARRVSERLQRDDLSGKTTVLKLRYSDFETLTRQSSLKTATNDANEIAFRIVRLFRRHRAAGRKIRLLGVAVSRLEHGRGSQQLSLFDADTASQGSSRGQDAGA